MSTNFVELENRVFEVTMEPDAEGWMRRTISVQLASGPPLTNEEWARIGIAVADQMRATGNVVRDIHFGGTIEEES